MAEKKIGDRTFRVQPLLAVQAITLQTRLVKVLGPAFERLPSVLAKMKDKTKSGTDAELLVISLIFEVVEKSTTQEITALLKDIVELAEVQRPSGDYDQVDMDGEFTGKLGDIFPVAAFVLAENFGDFFSGRLGSGGRAKIRAA